jgi:putative SOS response-associated peptidase YedK
MPVVIAPEAFDMWLDCANVDPQTAAALIVPAPENFFEAYEISTAVNRVANDSPDLLTPVAESTVAPELSPPAPRGSRAKRETGQGSLF